MVLDSFDSDRLKRSVAHVQRYLDHLNSARSDAIQQFDGEMQARRWRSYCPAPARKYGLVSLGVKAVLF
jgi:hypothetical protein